MLKMTLKSLKNHLKITSFAWGVAMLALSPSYVSAFDYEEVIKPIDEDIKRTGTSAHLKERVHYSDNYRVSPFALMICKADHERLAKSLKVITNPEDPNFLDINSPVLFEKGFRQVYNLASLAADPIWPIKERHSLQERLKTIDVLATTDINFNFQPVDANGKATPPTFEGSAIREYPGGLSIFSHYYQTPLACVYPLHGNWMETFSEDEEKRIHETRREMQARIILYGADPNIRGTSTTHSIDEENLQIVVKLARQQILNDKSLFSKIRPIEYVSSLLAHPSLTQAKEEYVTEETRKYEEILKRMKNLKF